jgi:hypothetical protein
VITVHPNPAQTPSQIIAALLARHPEAASLLAEASHCRALARSSAAYASQAFPAQQAARLAYEELRHRIDPRRRRTVPFGAGLLVIALLGTGLVLTDVFELSVTLGRTGALLLAIVGAVAWLTGAWMAALAGWEGRRSMSLAVSVTGIILGLLLAALHGFSRGGALLGISASMFVLVLASGAASLMTRMESASLYAARRRFQRAQAGYAAAVQAERSDAEAAAVTTESWLGLVRTCSGGIAQDESVVQETVTLAIALLDAGHPRREELSG